MYGNRPCGTARTYFPGFVRGFARPCFWAAQARSAALAVAYNNSFQHGDHPCDPSHRVNCVPRQITAPPYESQPKMRRTALLLLALGTASALPVVELQKDVYEVALKEVGTPWLIEIYSGMCASCKAYADIWHGVEAKVLQNTKVAVGRINMDEGGGPPLAMKYKGLLKDGIPAVIWIADPAKPYDHTVIDSGKARSSDERLGPRCCGRARGRCWKRRSGSALLTHTRCFSIRRPLRGPRPGGASGTHHRRSRSGNPSRPAAALAARQFPAAAAARRARAAAVAARAAPVGAALALALVRTIAGPMPLLAADEARPCRRRPPRVWTYRPASPQPCPHLGRASGCTT